MALDTATLGPSPIDVTALGRYVVFDVSPYAVASLSCSPGYGLDPGLLGVVTWQQSSDARTWVNLGQTFTAANMTSGHVIANIDIDTVRYLRAIVTTVGTAGEIHITVVAKAGATV